MSTSPRSTAPSRASGAALWWAIVAKLAAANKQLSEAQQATSEALELLVKQPVRLTLTNPETGEPMANLALLNDRVTLVPIQAINFGGSVVPLPAGDVESIASQTGSLVAFSIGTLTDGVTPALVCTPVPGGIDPGDTVTIADSDGLPSLVVGYTLNADTGAVAIQLNVAGSEFQPLPANPAQAATAKPVAEKVEPAAAATAPAAKPEEPKKA